MNRSLLLVGLIQLGASHSIPAAKPARQKIILLPGVEMFLSIFYKPLIFNLFHILPCHRRSIDPCPLFSLFGQDAIKNSSLQRKPSERGNESCLQRSLIRLFVRLAAKLSGQAIERELITAMD